MKNRLTGGIDVTVTPGAFSVLQSKHYTPDEASVVIVKDLFSRLRKVGSTGKQPICIDYMPLSIYGTDKRSNTRTLYCTLLASNKNDEMPKVLFRTKPLAKWETDDSKNTEFIINNVLSRHIFNYPALMQLALKLNSVKTLAQFQQLLHSCLVVFDQILQLVSYYRIPDFIAAPGMPKLVELASVNEISDTVLDLMTKFAKFNTALTSSPCTDQEAASLAAQIVAPIQQLLDRIALLQDSVFTLALYIYESESAAIEMIPYLNQQLVRSLSNPTRKDLDNKVAQYVTEITKFVHITALNAISINTASIECLKLFNENTPTDLYGSMMKSEKINSVFADTLAQFVHDDSINPADMKSFYDRHMFIANYELMQLLPLVSNSFTVPASYNLLTTLTEYVPLITKFKEVPNPILDNDEGESLWEKTFARNPNGLLSLAVYQYATASRNQFEVHTSMIHKQVDNDDVGSLVSVLLPCSVMDALADKYCVTPKSEVFKFSAVPKDNILAPSAYLSAIIMSALLCNVARGTGVTQLFTKEDSVRFAQSSFVAGYFSFDTALETKATVPYVASFDNIFGACGTHVPLNASVYTVTLSFYDLLLYKSLIASGKAVKGIEALKKDFNFLKWLNLNINDTLGLI